MSFGPTIAAGVETAFEVAKEFVVSGTYRQKLPGGTFDPVTETLTPFGDDILEVRFLPTNTKTEEREASPIAVTDLKLLVPGVDLGGVIPAEEDQVFIWGKWWNVVIARAVPGQSLWIIFVRKA